MSAPKPPAGTKAAGRKLWTSITSDFDLEEHELVLLREAVRTVDLLTDLDVLVKAEDPVVEGPQGQRAHPAAVEARQQRIVLARVLAALRLPSGEEGDQQPSARPQRRGGARGTYQIRACAVRRKEKRPAPQEPPAGVGIPPELRQPDAAVWRDQGAYHRHMRQRGWTMPARERFDVAVNPATRRRRAVAGWALASGITITVTYGQGSQVGPDWPQLRAWGLCE